MRRQNWGAAVPKRPGTGRRVLCVDGGKRLALAAVIAFYGVDGRRLTLTNDQAYDLVIDVAAGHLNSVDDIAARLRTAN